MAAINANIVVETTTLTVSPTTNTLGVTVDPINLNVFATGFAPAGGTNTQVQFNNNGALGGVANTSFASGNLTFTNLANLKINGGVNAYYLQTDGAGSLTWAAGGTPTGSGVPSGANTQIQLSDGSGAFDSGAGFTFDNVSNIFTAPGNINSTSGIFNGDGGGLSNIAAANVIGSLGSNIANGTSNVDIATSGGNVKVGIDGTADVVDIGSTATSITGDLTIVTGVITGDGGGLSNIAAANVTGLSLSQIANGTSNVDIATVDGNIDFAVGSANVARMSTTGAAYPGVLAVNGNITAKNDIEVESGAVFVGDGGGISNIASANIVGGIPVAVNVSANAQPNITSVGTLTSLSVSGNTALGPLTSIESATEIFDSSAITIGATDFDVLDGSILFSTSPLTGDVQLNFRGNSTVTLQNTIDVGSSYVATAILTVGATPYEITAITIDSISTPKVMLQLLY